MHPIKDQDQDSQPRPQLLQEYLATPLSDDLMLTGK